MMLVGTGSDVGKSVLAAAFCRIFRQDGYRPAPFKAQNMSLNSYATPDGLEIGRAQAVQAEAAGIPCEAEMNPVLLKPQGDQTSQVVLLGKPVGNMSARDYFRSEGRERLRHEVCAAFDRLAARFNPIVLEGAGSISELNLRDRDIVNLPMARHAQADVFLVGDIDRGGVFASLYGSIMLLPEEDRRLIKGIIVNKFRGDRSLFDDGVHMIEQLCGVPVVGVVPYFQDIHIEEEDSVELERKSRQVVSGQVNVAVVLLRHMSNFTDFDALEHDTRVHLYYAAHQADLQGADVVVVPGSKTTISDLQQLRNEGMTDAIVQAYDRGAVVLGICGGYQMLGREVLDPEHIEGGQERIEGIGLLPVVTTITQGKTTRQVAFQLVSGAREPDSADLLQGDEIHMGTTGPCVDAPQSPLCRLSDGSQDGYRVNSRLMGTYIHGILDHAAFVNQLLAACPAAHKVSTSTFDYAEFKEQQYDLLAAHVRRHVDMERIYQFLRGASSGKKMG